MTIRIVSHRQGKPYAVQKGDKELTVSCPQRTPQVRNKKINNPFFLMGERFLGTHAREDTKVISIIGIKVTQPEVSGDSMFRNC